MGCRSAPLRWLLLHPFSASPSFSASLHLRHQVCLEGMVRQKWGKVINITSQCAEIALPGHTAYCISKVYILAPPLVPCLSQNRRQTQLFSCCAPAHLPVVRRVNCIGLFMQWSRVGQQTTQFHTALICGVFHSFV